MAALLKCGLILGLTFIGVGAGARAGNISVGDVPEYSFRLPMINGPWATSLEALRGKPALFEFWGTRCPPCIVGAVPASLKLQEAFGDDLQVVFVESQGATIADAEAFAIEKRWMGGRALWTIEPPFLTGANMLPNFVLLGSDGRVLLKGNPLAQAREIDRLIADEIRKLREPPADVHPAVRNAWTEFRSHQVGRAVGEVRRLAGDAEATGEVKTVAATTLATFLDWVERDLARASALLAHGFYEDASVKLDRLSRDVLGDPEMEARVARLAQRLETPESVLERERERALQKLAARFFRTGGDRDSTAALSKFATEQAGSRAADRATHLANLVKR